MIKVINNTQIFLADKLTLDFAALERRAIERMVIPDFSSLERRAIAAVMHSSLPVFDLHRLLASGMFSVKYQEVTPKQRRASKTRYYHLLYTPGAKTLITPELLKQAFDEDALAGMLKESGLPTVECLAEAINLLYQPKESHHDHKR